MDDYLQDINIFLRLEKQWSVGHDKSGPNTATSDLLFMFEVCSLNAPAFTVIYCIVDPTVKCNCFLSN